MMMTMTLTLAFRFYRIILHHACSEIAHITLNSGIDFKRFAYEKCNANQDLIYEHSISVIP